MQRRVFRAMGTEIELLVGTDDDVADELDEAEREFHRLEALLSRFRADSELAQLNAEGTRKVSPELLELVALALDARERTRGRFDPTVHDALVAAGYDRSFDDLRAVVGVPDDAGRGCAGGVRVDEARRRVTLAPGHRLDLGGIAKGWAADRVASRLSHTGAVLVNAGGDVACAGVWPVGVETPAGSLTLELDDAGLATSGRDRRRWPTTAGEAHHLIDPATGAPAATDVLTVTAVAANAAEAEVRATSLFLAGSFDGARAEADVLGVPAVVVADDGRTAVAGGLA